MANYEQLKQSISDVIKDNGMQEITGDVLQSVLLSMVNILGNNAMYAGVAKPSTAPGTPDQNVFYIAGEPGVYSNFGGTVLNQGQLAVFSNEEGAWKSSVIDLASSLGKKSDDESADGTAWAQINLLKNRNLCNGYWATNIKGVQITITEDFKFKVHDTTSTSETSYVIYKDPISYTMYPRQTQSEEQLSINGGMLAICYNISNKRMVAVPYNDMGIIADYKNFTLIVLCNLTSKVVYYTGCVFQLFDKVYYPNPTDLSDVVGSFNNIPAKDGNVIERLLYIQNQTNRLLNKGIVYDADNTPVLSIDTSANTITYKKVLSARIYVLYGEPLNYNIKLPESEERTVPVSGTFVGIYAIVFKLSTKEILNVQYSDWATELSDFKDFLLLAVYNYGTGIVKWTNIPIAINGKIYRPATVDYTDVIPDIESRVKRYFSHGYWVSNYDNPQVIISEDGFCTVEATNTPSNKGTFIVYNEPYVLEMYAKKDSEKTEIAAKEGIQFVFYQISTKSIKHISYTGISSIYSSYQDYVLLVLYHWNSKVVYYTGCVFQLFDKVYYPSSYKQDVPSVVNKPSLSFKGKTYLSLGDSITAPSDSYASIIANNFDLVWHNFGVSGCHWTNYDGTKVDFSQNPIHSELSNQNYMNVIQNQVYRVLQKITGTSDIVPEISASTEFYTDYSYPVYGTNEINAEDVYLVTIACGTNDCSNSKPIGDYESVANVPYTELDKKTMWSAIKWAVIVLRKYLPNANIVIFAPIQRANNSNLLDYVNAEIEASVRFACSCVNMFNEIGIMQEIEAVEHRYLSDGLHPNAAGKSLMGGILSSKLLTWFQL